MTSPASNLYLGMLSGTSRDGVDIALVRFAEGQPELIASQCVPYPAGLAESLTRMVQLHRRPNDDELALADRELAEFFALAAWGLLDRAGINPRSLAAIGSHGQTVWHSPSRQNPESIQLGNPQHIANVLKVTTVGKFRQADIDAGGQGAPLAPLLHRALLTPASGTRAVVNLGGIANISLIDSAGGVTGYDTGPANCLLDAWVHKHFKRSFDENGAWAEKGVTDQELLKRLLSDPYFSMRPPKSTGIEYFNIYWLYSKLEEHSGSTGSPDPVDVQATLAELTARSVADAVLQSEASDLLLCGGGTHNQDLVQRLNRLLPDLPINSSSSQGIEPDWMEGILFAWLARERLEGREQQTGPITGARKPVLLGEVFQPTA